MGLCLYIHFNHINYIFLEGEFYKRIMSKTLNQSVLSYAVFGNTTAVMNHFWAKVCFWQKVQVRGITNRFLFWVHDCQSRIVTAVDLFCQLVVNQISVLNMLRLGRKWDVGSDFYCIKFLPSIESQLSYFLNNSKSGTRVIGSFISMFNVCIIKLQSIGCCTLLKVVYSEQLLCIVHYTHYILLR